jgi:DNA-binding transcriptional MerR regulator
MLKIGDFSRLSQIPVKTLRFYDDVRLLSPIHVDSATGYRYYSADQLSQLNRILVFKDLGFSLGEIADLLKRDVPVEDIRSLLHIKRTELERKVEEERARLARLEARISQIDSEDAAPSYDVVLKRTGPKLVASLRNTLRSYEGADELFDEIKSYVECQGVTGDRGALWHTCLRSGGTIDCEAFVLLKNPIPSNNRVRIYDLPAQTMACVVHRGPDEESEQAYVAARRWIKVSGYASAGPTREVYFYENRRTGESIFEIQFPVVSARRAKPLDEHAA